jgi:hypothetical protein
MNNDEDDNNNNNNNNNNNHVVMAIVEMLTQILSWVEALSFLGLIVTTMVILFTISLLSMTY